MSLRNKFFSILTIAIATIAFSAISFGQDKTTTTTTTTDTTQTPEKGEGRGAGHRKFDGAGKEGREGFGGREGGPGRMMGMFRGANLTDAQKTQIHSILEANRPDRSNMEAMRTIIQAKRAGTITADQEAQLKAFREQSRAKGKAVHDQLLAVLTPEQKQAIEQKRQEMKQKREEFRKQRELRKATPATTPTPTTTDKPKTN